MLGTILWSPYSRFLKISRTGTFWESNVSEKHVAELDRKVVRRPKAGSVCKRPTRIAGACIPLRSKRPYSAFTSQEIERSPCVWCFPIVLKVSGIERKPLPSKKDSLN